MDITFEMYIFALVATCRRAVLSHSLTQHSTACVLSETLRLRYDASPSGVQGPLMPKHSLSFVTALKQTITNLMCSSFMRQSLPQNHLLQPLPASYGG